VMTICQQELQSLIDNDFKLIFKQPSKEQTRTVMAGSLEQQSKLKDLKRTRDELKRLGMSDEDIFNVLHEK